MSWREAFRLSDVAFTELSLQAVYAFRQGNVLPPGQSKNMVARSRRRVLQSKFVISVVLGLLTLGAAWFIHERAANPTLLAAVPVGLFQSAVLTGLFSLDIALLWWTGVQVIPTLISSGVLPVLEPLPIDQKTFQRVAGILYLRLFDFPALTILILTPIAVGVALGPLAGLASFPGALVSVAYALALSLLTGRFFLRRVQGSRGGGGRTVVRWAYLVLWLVPAFAMFGFLTAAPAFLRGLAALAVQGPSLESALLAAAFPFSFAALPAIVSGGTSSMAVFSPVVDLALALAVVIYLTLALWSVVWLARSVRTLLFLPAQTPVGLPAASSTLRPMGRARAVLVKDLRIASRTPGYAFLILLPILDAGALGLLTYATPAQNPVAASLALGAVTTAALLATFFGPAFFAIEVVAYSVRPEPPALEPVGDPRQGGVDLPHVPRRGRPHRWVHAAAVLPAVHLRRVRPRRAPGRTRGGVPRARAPLPLGPTPGPRDRKPVCGRVVRGPRVDPRAPHGGTPPASL